MGVPWWDVLVPTVASFYGKVACISEPLLAHMCHPEIWNKEEYHRVGTLARDVLLDQAEKMADKSDVAHDFLEQYRDFLSRMKGEKERRVLFNLNQFCWKWIWKNSRIISSPVRLDSDLFRSSFQTSIEARKTVPFRLDSLSAHSSFRDILRTFKEDSLRTVRLFFRHFETWVRYKVRPK
jgi:hypothetical protein